MNSVSTESEVAPAAREKPSAFAGQWLPLVWLLATVAGIMSVSVCSPKTLGIFASDDSFYYFLTARNTVLGNGVSFDGINATNGFHPLWMLVLLPIFAVTGGDHDISLRLVYGLLVLLYSGSIALGYRLLMVVVGRFAALLTIPLFLNPIVFNLFFNGLESAVVIFLLLSLLYVARRKDFVSPQMALKNQALAGLFLGLIFLSRLDCAFHLMALGVVALIIYRLPVWNPMAWPSLLRSYGVLLLVFLLVVAPYFAWNLVANGHLSPISGSLKSSFPDPEPRINALTAASRAPYTLFIALSIGIGLIQLASPGSPLRRLISNRGEGKPWNVLLTALWLGCILHFGYTLFFTTWGTHQWHFASYVPLMLLVVGWLFGKFASWSRWFACGAALLLLGASAAMLVLSVKMKAGQHANWHEAAEWARTQTPQDSIFAMTDAGYFAYFSRRDTVNLDGLINGYEYQDALANGRLDEYLEDCGISFVCDYEVPALQTGDHSIRLDRLFLAEKRSGKRGYDFTFPLDQTVYTSVPYAAYSLKAEPDARNQILFCIWPFDKGTLTRLVPVASAASR